MKKFKQLWYYGLSIVGIPVVIVIMAAFFAIAHNLNKSVNKAVEEEVQPKVDTVIVEKPVIVKDTVYLPAKTKPTPVAPVKDTL